jgi:hypothetical protein
VPEKPQKSGPSGGKLFTWGRNGFNAPMDGTKFLNCCALFTLDNIKRHEHQSVARVAYFIGIHAETKVNRQSAKPREPFSTNFSTAFVDRLAGSWEIRAFQGVEA